MNWWCVSNDIDDVKISIIIIIIDDYYYWLIDDIIIIINVNEGIINNNDIN